jgi:hypothetical protein
MRWLLDKKNSGDESPLMQAFGGSCSGASGWLKTARLGKDCCVGCLFCSKSAANILAARMVLIVQIIAEESSHVNRPVLTNVQIRVNVW